MPGTLVLILTATLWEGIYEIISQRRKWRLNNWLKVILCNYADDTVIESEATSHTAQRLTTPIKAY